MSEINYWAIIVSVLVAFVASAVWYILFAKQRARLSPAARESGRPQPKLLAAELGKNIVLALFINYFVHGLGITTLTDAFYLTLILWVAFPVLILVSSVMYEKVPVKLAAIHAGDWLLKLLLMVSILSLWQK